MTGKLFTAVCIMLPFYSPGQDSIQHKVQIGYSIGYTNTTIDGTIVDHYNKRPTGNQKRRTGFTTSLALKWILSKAVYLETGLGYYQKGGYHYNSGYVDNLIMSGNYLDIPLVVGLRSPKGPTRIAIEAGFSYGLMINCSGRGCYNLDRTFNLPTPPTNLDKPGTTFDIHNPIAVLYGAGFEFEGTKRVSVLTRVRFYDDLNYFFGDKRDFSIAGKGFAVEIGGRYKIK